MIDLTSESLLTLTEAAAFLPRTRGQKVHVSTLWRWHVKGHRGVKLECLRLGGRLWTSRESLQRFSTALSEQRDDASVRFVFPKPQQTRSRLASVAAAQRTLEAAGI